MTHKYFSFDINIKTTHTPIKKAHKCVSDANTETQISVVTFLYNLLNLHLQTVCYLQTPRHLFVWNFCNSPDLCHVIGWKGGWHLNGYRQFLVNQNVYVNGFASGESQKFDTQTTVSLSIQQFVYKCHNIHVFINIANSLKYLHLWISATHN